MMDMLQELDKISHATTVRNMAVEEVYSCMFRNFNRFMRPRVFGGVFENPEYALLEFTPESGKWLQTIWPTAQTRITPDPILYILHIEVVTICIPAFLKHCSRICDTIDQMKSSDATLSEAMHKEIAAATRQQEIDKRATSEHAIRMIQSMMVHANVWMGFEHPSYSETQSMV